jgi:hypothetical protein
LKTLLPLAFLFIGVFCGCNNKKANTTDDDKKPATDSTADMLIYLSSANNLQQLLCQNWQNKEDTDDGILDSGGGGDDGLQIPFRGYCFFEDGGILQNPRDEIKLGKWAMDEKAKIINIVFEDDKKKTCVLKAIGVKNLLLQNGNDAPVKFIADGKKYENPEDDPFYPANNRWRIKPIRAESNSAIKQRVIQCVLFYNKFLQDQVNRKMTVISFYGIPSCFTWYKGGISIINKDKIGPKWIGCFYNKVQAIKGQQMLKGVISKKYKWDAAEKNWVKQSADVLLQIADALRPS